MLSLVVPVYKNEANVASLVAAIGELADALPQGLEAVFVVDGSPDASHALLERALTQVSWSSQLVLLARNFGSFAAIRCGLAAARGEHLAVMAADLQEPPELVLQMQRLLATGELDVVVGQRQGRNDPLQHRLFSSLFWRLYRGMVFPDMPPGGVDIFACNRRVRDELLRLDEQNSSLVAQLFWLGYRRGTIPYVRRRREQGVSAWTLRKKLRYLGDSIFSFTDLPIRLLLTLGGLATLVSGAFGLVVLTQRLMGLITATGYSATVLMVIFFGALNVTATGVVGAYAWRTYENSKRRPLHLVQQHLSYPQKEKVGAAQEAARAQGAP